MQRLWLFLALGLTLAVAQLTHEPAVSRLRLSTSQPARVALFKNGRPFRFHPVDAILPIKVDTFYRDQLWRRGVPVRTLEVTALDQSHFYLLDGSADFELPAGDYSVEAYRGLFHMPARASFTLRPGQPADVSLDLVRWDPETANWLSGDDHIHLTRTPEDNDIFLRWQQAEDLTVGNYLQLQRQIDAAPQYAFGRAGEAALPSSVIRSGQESRSEYYGHVNLLGGDRLIRPLSVGQMYANEPAAYPYPSRLFADGRSASALTGFAHFHGSMPHSTLLMDLALGNVQFLEVFQFGRLWTEEWYELLQAGFRPTGVAGSDFPVPLGRFVPWPARLPLLGPERTLVPAAPGGRLFDTWAEGVRRGAVVVSNGPFVTIERRGGRIHARASFSEPLAALEIVHNGKVVSAATGASRLSLSAAEASGWWAARVRTTKREAEPLLQAHTNPIDIGPPTPDAAIRAAIARRWEDELRYYRAANLPFASSAQRDQFFSDGERALAALKSTPRR